MLERRVRKKIEWAFYNYKAISTTAEKYILEVAEKQLSVSYDKLPVQSSAGNSVESSVIKALDKGDAYKWCKVVEQTLEHFAGTGKDTLIRLKYFEKLREWKLCQKLYVEHTSIYRWVDEAMIYAAMVALQFGLIRIF